MPRGVQEGTRRGRYSRGEKVAEPEQPPVTPGTDLEEVLERIRAESPLRHAAGLELALRAIRVLMLEQVRLSELVKSGKITSEESKQVNANASNLRRWFEAIGLTGAPKRSELKDPEEDDEPL